MRGKKRAERIEEDPLRYVLYTRKSTDYIVRMNIIMTAIFSNLTITDKKVTGHRFAEPYERLLSVSQNDLVGNRGLEPLTSSV